MLRKLMYIHRYTVCTYSVCMYVRMYFVCVVCIVVMYVIRPPPPGTVLSLYVLYVCIVTANTHVLCMTVCIP